MLARNRLTLVIATLLLGLALGACGPLPRPFKPDEQKAVDLRALTYGSTVVVLPPEGDLPADPDPVTEALRDALLAEGLLAKTWREAEGALQLSGHAQVRPLGGGSELLSASWRIDGPQGRLADFRQERTLPADAWQASDPPTLQQVASEAAQALASQLLGPAPQAALLPGFPGARLVVPPASGAPGDGDEALAEALKVALRRAELPVVPAGEPRGERDLLVRGTVEVTPPEAGRQQVSIVWRLEDPAGRELGQIAQSNAMPAGSLDGAWGRIAALVARGAADGLADLLDRLARQRAATR